MHNYYSYLYNKPCSSCCAAARRAGGRGLRPVGHRGRPALPGALGRRLRVDVRRDGREPARRVVAGCPASGSGATTSAASKGARPGGLQAVDPVRSAVHAQPAARQRQLPGALAVRRGVGRRPPQLHPAEEAADAVPLRAGGGRRAGTGVPVLRPMAVEFPDDPACALSGPPVHARAIPCWSRRCSPRPARLRTTSRPATWTHCRPARPSAVRAGSRGVRLRHRPRVRPSRLGVALGARDDRPDYAYAEGVTLRAYELADGAPVGGAGAGTQRERAPRCSRWAATVGTLTATRLRRRDGLGTGGRTGGTGHQRRRRRRRGSVEI